LFTKVLKHHGDVDDENYDWMLLNQGKGLLEKKRQSTFRAPPPQAQEVYGRTQPPMIQPQHQQVVVDYQDESRKKGFWQQFISFVTCGLFSCL
jgi:casein kinase 1